jgi:hypothetical protein
VSCRIVSTSSLPCRPQQPDRRVRWVKPIFDAVSYTPVGWGEPINERLAEHPDGKRRLRRMAGVGLGCAAWPCRAGEIIRDNFEDDHCRSFLLWMAFQTVVAPEWPMSGRLAYCAGPWSPALELVRAERRLGRVLWRARAADRSARRRHRDQQERGVTDRRERPLRRRRLLRRQRLPGRPGGAVDDPHQASGRHGAGRGLVRRLHRRCGDLVRRSDPVRADAVSS